MSATPDQNHNASEFAIAENRRARNWTKKELVSRLLWETIGKTLMALSPRPCWAFRRVLLRVFGARVGKNVHIFPTVDIAIPWNLEIKQFAAVGNKAILYSLGTISIGSRATISQFSHICAGTHDHRERTFDLLKPPIEIGDDTWICASAFIGPGVTIGARAVVGACAVVIRDVDPGHIVAGNPARVVGERPVK